MSIRARNNLIELLEEYNLLKAEYDKANSITLNDSDLEGLRKKAGNRAVTLTVKALKDDIMKDIREVEEALNGIICVYEHETKGFIGFHVNELAEKLTQHYVGSIDNLPKDGREWVLKQISGTIDIIMKLLKSK